MSPVHNKKMFKKHVFYQRVRSVLLQSGRLEEVVYISPKACLLFIHILYIYVYMYIRSQSIFCDKLVQSPELGICRFGSKFREHSALHVRTSEDKNIHI